MEKGEGVQNYSMSLEEEIDLRTYVEVLIRYWKWIVGVALAAAVTAFVVSILISPTYEASSVVIITQPRYQMQFAESFEPVDWWSPIYKVFPTLATSDEVLQNVVDAHTPSAVSNIKGWKLKMLSSMVEATSEGDPSLVVLKVRSRFPEDAAAIANTWADILVQQGDKIYGGGGEDVAFFEKQAAQAKASLDKAETALIAFQSRNQTSIVGAQLNSLNQFQTDYLAQQRTIVYTIQDIQRLRDQLAQQPRNRSASLADALTVLSLQVKAFNAQTAVMPIQLQIDSTKSLSDESLAEHVAFLDDLVETLEAKSSEIAEQLAELEPQILALQEQFQKTKIEYDYLTRTRDLARETYTALSRKLEETRISAQEKNDVLQVGSYAATPEVPTSPRKMLNTAIGGMLGVVVGVLGAFTLEWWQEAGKQKGADTRG